uniref:Lipoprotein n=1 Tax=Uncultured bacterium HF130_AEPn_1 TaxID=663362 RepID=D0E8K3_UNCHF|nr:hypothetical protein ALOHA_HF130_AEPn_1_24 [uncultured bacterium HF130_AEPn_1]
MFKMKLLYLAFIFALCSCGSESRLEKTQAPDINICEIVAEHSKACQSDASNLERCIGKIEKMSIQESAQLRSCIKEYESNKNCDAFKKNCVSKFQLF